MAYPNRDDREPSPRSALVDQLAAHATADMAHGFRRGGQTAADIIEQAASGTTGPHRDAIIQFAGAVAKAIREAAETATRQAGASA